MQYWVVVIAYSLITHIILIYITNEKNDYFGMRGIGYVGSCSYGLQNV